MKKILFLLLVPSFLFAQTEQTKSIAELKSQINVDITDQSIQQFQPQMEKKSAGLAILYSMLLPGMGELYAGDYSSGLYFTIADAVFWGGVAGFNIYGNWQEDNYKSFAQSNGGADVAGKDEDYFSNIGLYVDIHEYNEIQKLSRNFDEIYDVETHYWDWKSNDQRSEYRSMWTSSESAFNNVRFAVGALLVNRVVSVINAVRLVNAHNNKVENMEWNVSVGMTNYPNLPSSLNLNFSTSF